MLNVARKLLSNIYYTELLAQKLSEKNLGP